MMEPNRDNPFWGNYVYCSDNIDAEELVESMNVYCTDDTAAVELDDPLIMDDILVQTTFMNSGDLNPMPDGDITGPLNNGSANKKALKMEMGIELQPIGSHQSKLHEIKGENAGYDERFQELISDVISGTPDINYEFSVAEEVQEKERHRSKTYKMVKEKKENRLFAKMESDIPVKVVGAQNGQLVKMSLRYSTGCYYDTPVTPCCEHSSNMSDKRFSFCIPKLYARKVMDDGHPTLEVPVPILPLGEDFQFFILFHCLNSCHGRFGKCQEMILKLYDSEGMQLQERCINIRICANVKRDISVYYKNQGKEKGVKRPGEKNDKKSAAKKMKTEEEVAVEAREVTGAAAPTLVNQPLIGASPCCFMVELPNDIHFNAIANIVEGLNGKVTKLEDTAAPPLP